LSSLATDAGTFKDQRLRARTQARIAEFLWEAETDRASNLFRKAWDAAEIADAESQQELQDEICAQRAKSGGGGGGGGRLSKLADADFDRAVELARVFEREAPRAHAVMAIALTVLTEKKR
jgi:hypothetical protein